jgi:protein TonB
LTAHPDILERKDGLRTSFAGSLLFHVSVFGGLVAASLVSTTKTEHWGYENALNGGSVSVTPVGIPLPRTSPRVNPVATDSDSNVPVEPVKEKKAKREKVVPDDEDAIPLKSKKSKKHTKERTYEPHHYVPKEVYKSNQVYSTVPQAVSSPLYSGTPGTGIGIGNGNPFGNRFGAYADMLRRRISEKWRTNEIDPRIKTSPPAVVTFEILRNGTIRNVTIKERSGILPLDYSAMRAVQEAAPFEPLPREYERDSAVIELSFHLKR